MASSLEGSRVNPIEIDDSDGDDFPEARSSQPPRREEAAPGLSTPIGGYPQARRNLSDREVDQFFLNDPLPPADQYRPRQQTRNVPHLGDAHGHTLLAAQWHFRENPLGEQRVFYEQQVEEGAAIQPGYNAYRRAEDVNRPFALPGSGGEYLESFLRDGDLDDPEALQRAVDDSFEVQTPDGIEDIIGPLPPNTFHDRPAPTNPSNSSRTLSTPEWNQRQEEACLARILDVFPDISRDYLTKLFRDRRTQDVKLGLFDRFSYDPSEALIHKILAGPYPKQKDRKRKRSLSPARDDAKRQIWERQDRHRDRSYQDLARKLLVQDFPNVPNSHIEKELRSGKPLFIVYLILTQSMRSEDFPGRQDYSPLQRSQQQGLPTFDRYDVFEELKNARSEATKLKASAHDHNAVEEPSVLEHQRQGQMIECRCCFSEYPSDETVHCNAEQAHFFCQDCVRNLAANVIGGSRYELKCMDPSICKGTFTKRQYSQCLDQKTIEKLGQLEQLEQVRLADIEGLAECPFCEYKAIYPPVEEDKEFRCQHPDCLKVSCRLCLKETHVPKSCEDDAVSARHAIEEAMTEAMVRTCPNCKARIVKESGCNRMTCARCKREMCYICRKDITLGGYSHFSSRPPACPLSDSGTDALHEGEVNTAEKAAIDKVRREDSSLKEEDLRVKVTGGASRHQPGPAQGNQVPRFLAPNGNAGHGYVPGQLQNNGQGYGTEYGLLQQNPPRPPPPPQPRRWKRPSSRRRAGRRQR